MYPYKYAAQSPGALNSLLGGIIKVTTALTVSGTTRRNTHSVRTRVIPAATNNTGAQTDAELRDDGTISHCCVGNKFRNGDSVVQKQCRDRRSKAGGGERIGCGRHRCDDSAVQQPSLGPFLCLWYQKEHHGRLDSSTVIVITAAIQSGLYYY